MSARVSRSVSADNWRFDRFRSKHNARSADDCAARYGTIEDCHEPACHRRAASYRSRRSRGERRRVRPPSARREPQSGHDQDVPPGGRHLRPSRRSAASTSRRSSPISSRAGAPRPRPTGTAGSSASLPGWSTRASCGPARWPGCGRRTCPRRRSRSSPTTSSSASSRRASAGPASSTCRDAALIRVFIDTGARRAEVAGLRYDPADETANDVDLDQGILRVVGKGRRERVVAVGSKTVRALDRYLRGSETTCIPTGCAIRSRTAGWPGVAARPI